VCTERHVPSEDSAIISFFLLCAILCPGAFDRIENQCNEHFDRSIEQDIGADLFELERQRKNFGLLFVDRASLHKKWYALFLLKECSVLTRSFKYVASCRHKGDCEISDAKNALDVK
jgi:hypothetical protein